MEYERARNTYQDYPNILFHSVIGEHDQPTEEGGSYDGDDDCSEGTDEGEHNGFMAMTLANVLVSWQEGKGGAAVWDTKIGRRNEGNEGVGEGHGEDEDADSQ